MSAIFDTKRGAVVLGLIMSYLVWDLPMRLGSIDEETIYIFALDVGMPAAARFGDDIAREIVLALIVIARGFPALIALSMFTACLMRMIKHPNIFLYVMPAWPAVVHLLSLHLFLGPGRGLGGSPVDWLWLLRYNDSRGSAAVFITFFVLTYLLYVVGGLFDKAQHGPA